MGVDYAYQFDPEHDSIVDLLARAKRVGITVTPTGRVYVRRSRWEKGRESGKKPVVYLIYKEALRSHRHEVASILKRAKVHREFLEEFRDFHAWLLSQRLDSALKKTEAVERMSQAVGQLAGVRCANLVELKAHLKGSEELLSAALRELLEKKQWGAACCKIVYRLRPTLDREHRRVIAQVPKILYKEALLGKIWEHDCLVARRLRQATIDFGKQCDSFVRNGTSLGELRTSLKNLLLKFHIVFDFRLKDARSALKGLQAALTGGDGREVFRQLIFAQYKLREYEKWLMLADSQKAAS